MESQGFKLLIAEEFYARAAVILVHSFSPSNKWFEDFEAFAALFEVRPKVAELAAVGELRATPLFLGWCRGDQRFQESEGA